MTTTQFYNGSDNTKYLLERDKQLFFNVGVPCNLQSKLCAACSCIAKPATFAKVTEFIFEHYNFNIIPFIRLI